METITTNNGTTFTIEENESCVDIDCTTVVKAVYDTEIKLVDRRGIEVIFPKEILESNRISFSDGRIILSREMYRSSFEKKFESDMHKTSDIVFDNFGKLLAMKSKLIQSQKTFLLRLPQLFTGFGHQVCLGGWLEAIDEFTVIPQSASGNDSSVAIISLNGSPLSGLHSWTGYDLEDNRIVTGRNSLKEYGTLRHLFKNYSAKYPIRLKSVYKDSFELSAMLL